VINYVTGDIFESGTQALVCPINCVGVMGKGLALQFKNRYPGNYRLYKHACAKGQVKPGKMFITKEHEIYIINFPTKRHWRNQSILSDIDEGLIELRRVIKRLELKDIAIPALGCGNGQLLWYQVKTLLETHLSNLDNNIIIYGPFKNTNKEIINGII
jgi:O-acetyl-ADP-ribose deacetylase (regulator of RNase III)